MSPKVLIIGQSGHTGGGWIEELRSLGTAYLGTRSLDLSSLRLTVSNEKDLYSNNETNTDSMKIKTITYYSRDYKCL